jgi:hypothetical protein
MKVQGGDLRLSRCTLIGPLSKAPDSFRSLIAFDGAGAAAKPTLIALRECAFLSGRGILELRGAGQRLRARGCLFYALGDAVAFDLGTLESSRPDVVAVFEHNTMALRQTFTTMRVSDAPATCLPIVVQTQSNYFLDPFTEEPRQSSLLRAYADTLGRGLLTWQGKDNYFSDRWHAFTTFNGVPPKQPIAAWQRLWGPVGEIAPQIIEPLAVKTFLVDQPAYDRLALPSAIRVEPLPGADLARLGLVKKK